jgi:hypothetical protein
MTHTELCNLGAKYLKTHGLIRFGKPKYVVIEICCTIPCEPDIFAFGGYYTQQVEVKVSRSDFLADRKKPHRINSSEDVGQLRSYLCPHGMIKQEELPDKWGLLYIDERNKISVVKFPEKQDSCSYFEINIITSILRRIEVKEQIFSFKNHSNNLKQTQC